MPVDGSWIPHVLSPSDAHGVLRLGPFAVVAGVALWLHRSEREAGTPLLTSAPGALLAAVPAMLYTAFLLAGIASEGLVHDDLLTSLRLPGHGRLWWLSADTGNPGITYRSLAILLGVEDRLDGLRLMVAAFVPLLAVALTRPLTRVVAPGWAAVGALCVMVSTQPFYRLYMARPHATAMVLGTVAAARVLSRADGARASLLPVLLGLALGAADNPLLLLLLPALYLVDQPEGEDRTRWKAIAVAAFATGGLPSLVAMLHHQGPQPQDEDLWDSLTAVFTPYLHLLLVAALPLDGVAARMRRMALGLLAVALGLQVLGVVPPGARGFGSLEAVVGLAVMRALLPRMAAGGHTWLGALLLLFGADAGMDGWRQVSHRAEEARSVMAALVPQVPEDRTVHVFPPELAVELVSATRPETTRTHPFLTPGRIRPTPPEQGGHEPCTDEAHEDAWVLVRRSYAPHYAPPRCERCAVVATHEGWELLRCEGLLPPLPPTGPPGMERHGPPPGPPPPRL